MRIMIRSYSEKCQVHDVESAADIEISLSHISHSSAGVLQHLDHDIIGTCHDFNEY